MSGYYDYYSYVEDDIFEAIMGSGVFIATLSPDNIKGPLFDKIWDEGSVTAPGGMGGFIHYDENLVGNLELLADLIETYGEDSDYERALRDTQWADGFIRRCLFREAFDQVYDRDESVEEFINEFHSNKSDNKKPTKAKKTVKKSVRSKSVKRPAKKVRR